MLFRCATIHHSRGRLQDAKQSYLAVLSQPCSGDFGSIDVGIEGFKSRHNLAIVCEQLGETQAAEDLWRHILQEAPQFTHAWYALAEMLLSAGRVAEVEPLVLSARQPAIAAALRAKIAAHQGDFRRAARELEAALQRSPDDVELQQDYCRLLFDHGTPQATATALRRLLELQPDDAAAYHNLGVALLRAGEFTQAAAAFASSLRRRPDSSETQHYLEVAEQAGGACVSGDEPSMNPLA